MPQPLNYASSTISGFRPILWRGFKWAGLALAMIYIACIPFNVFYGGSVCQHCGITRSEKTWCLPILEGRVYTSYRESATPLSTCLAKEGLLDTHEHQWLFATGSGAGVTCALGEGRYQFADATGKGLANFVHSEFESGETKRVARVLSIFRDPTLRRSWNGLSLIFNAYRDGVPDGQYRSVYLEMIDEAINGIRQQCNLDSRPVPWPDDDTPPKRQ